MSRHHHDHHPPPLALSGPALPLLPLAMTLVGTTWLVLRGVIARHRYESAIAAARTEARTDALTGLPNRRFVMEELDADHVALIALLDLDGFKQINDTRGHSAGDQLLSAVAERLRRTAHARGALAARLAGDEFVLVWHQPRHRGPGPGTATRRVRRMLAPVARPVRIDGHRIPVRISVGLAVARPDLHGRDLLAAADAAMYRVKRERAGLPGAPALSVHAWRTSPESATRDRRSHRSAADDFLNTPPETPYPKEGPR